MRRLLAGLVAPALAVGVFIGLSPALATTVEAQSCNGVYDHEAHTTIGSLSIYSDLVAANCGNGNWQYTSYLSSYGGSMTGPMDVNVRVWVCGTYQGSWNYYYSGNSAGIRVTSPEFYYGSCGLQADNEYTFFYVGSTFHYAPYVHY